jgi:hypothetical protein
MAAEVLIPDRVLDRTNGCMGANLDEAVGESPREVTNGVNVMNPEEIFAISRKQPPE